MIGRTLNHYEVLEKLGQGGMGHVYLAEDTRLHRRVALKVLPQEMAGDERRIARFEREAQAVAALSHPNIVTLFSVEEADEVRFLTMELVDGRPLDDLIPLGGLELEEFFELTVPLASAVAAAHRQGIIHRDIKPANVMVDSEGTVKLLDLGLAKLREPEPDLGGDQTLTQEGRVIGTVPYMAPEQLAGKPSDHRVDVFALGVVLYQMLTGSRPFHAESSAELISSILRDNPQPITETNPTLPTHLWRVVRKCLEKDPGKRFDNADDLRDELKTMQRLEQRGELHTPSGELVATAETSHRRPQWLTALGIVLGVTVVATVLFSVTSRREGLLPESRQPPASGPPIVAATTDRFVESRSVGENVEDLLPFPESPADSRPSAEREDPAPVTPPRSEAPAAVEPETSVPEVRPADVQMSLTLSSAAPSGVVTLYADDLQIYRRPFDFAQRKRGVLGRLGLKKRAPGELEDGITVPGDTESLRLYVALSEQPARQFIVPGGWRSDGTDTLAIVVDADGRLDVRFNGQPAGGSL